MPPDWTPDEFTQESPDYTGKPVVSSTRIRSGKRSKAAKTAATARWRKRNKGKYRDYMRRYMASRRAALPGIVQDRTI